MLAVMVVMMAVIWIVSGHMGMMGHGDHHEKPTGTAQPTTSEPVVPAPQTLPEQQK